MTLLASRGRWLGSSGGTNGSSSHHQGRRKLPPAHASVGASRRTYQRERELKEILKAPTPPRIVHIDTETTGLHPHEGQLLEIAVVITDDDLHPIAEYTSLIEHDLQQARAALDPFTRSMHEANALSKTSNPFQGPRASCLRGGGAILVPTLTAQPGRSRRIQHRLRPRVAGCPRANPRTGITCTTGTSTCHPPSRSLARRWAPDVFAAAPEKRLGHRALRVTSTNHSGADAPPRGRLPARVRRAAQLRPQGLESPRALSCVSASPWRSA